MLAMLMPRDIVIILIILLLGLSVTVAAQTDVEEQCSPVDLRDELPPVWNQWTIKDCYSYVAADLLTHEIGKVVAPKYISLNYNLHRRYTSKTGHGGSTAKALRFALEQGFCLEQDHEAAWGPIEAKNLGEFIAIEGGGDLRWCNSAARKRALRLVDNHNIDIYTIFTIINLLKKGNSQVDKLSDVVGKSCYKITKYKDKSLRVKQLVGSKRTSATLIKKIDQQLNKRKLSAISFPLIMFKNPKNRIRQGGHAGSIVGRRWNSIKKSCEYLLRNSWGKGCSYRSYHQDYQCEKGNIWIPRQTLQRSIKRLRYLDRSPN